MKGIALPFQEIGSSTNTMKFLVLAALIVSVSAVPAAIYGGYDAGYAAAPVLAAPYAIAAPAGLGGNGFGHGGPYSPMPVQTVQLVGVPQPVPVAQPVPVDKPYAVPVDQPYTVPIDRPVAAPYVAKVVQPVVHKQTVLSSAVLSHGIHKK